MQEWRKVRAHACFRLDIQYPIGNGMQASAIDDELADLWQSLSYRITRNPGDLVAHTRRVRLCHETALQGKLAGALDDLAYFLGNRGASLQHRLRSESAAFLPDTTHSDRGELSDESTQVVANGRVLPTLTQLLRDEKVERAIRPS